MANWQEKWPEARPRWGTYSVKAHQKLDQLIADLLTYDVLVFPSPEDEAEWERWQREGWDPGLLALRFNQLGDHAVAMPWDSTLRDAWRHNWWNLPAEEREDPEAAFSITAAMIAEAPLVKLMGEEDDRFGQAILEQPRVHSALASHKAWQRARQEPLELISVFQSHNDAIALTAAGGAPTSSSDVAYGLNDGIRLRLQLEVPEESERGNLAPYH